MVEVVEAAARELADTAEWYESAGSGLGERFLDEVRGVFDLVERMPLAGSPWLFAGIPVGTRHVPLRMFPISVVYVTEPRLVVIAVAHGSREPRYWIDRLDDL